MVFGVSRGSPQYQSPFWRRSLNLTRLDRSLIFLQQLLLVNRKMRASKPSADELLNVFPVPADALGSATVSTHGSHEEALLPGESRLFHPVNSAFCRYLLLLVSSLTLSGCAGMVDMVRDVARSLADIDVSGVTELFGGGGVQLSPEQIAQLEVIPSTRPGWQASVEESPAAVFLPVFGDDAVYAGGPDGRLIRFDAASGKASGVIDTKHRLAGGIGEGDGMLLVGTFKGEVLAFDEKSGKPRWAAQVSTEVLSPPHAAMDMVIVRTGDGRIYGLDGATGKRKWVYQGATPSLTVRSFAGALIVDERVYAGFAGGRLVALNLANGSLVWEAMVSRPRGATELERISDVTSLPVADQQQVCAVAYQGRIACFEITTGNQIWARDVSSNAGLAMDDHYVYVSENRGGVVAYDKRDGTSVWAQDLLNGLKLSAPLVHGALIVVGDSQGYVNFLRNDSGAIIARSGTDEGAITARPISLPNGIAVQTRKGGVFAFGT